MKVTFSADREGIQAGKAQTRYLRLCVQTGSSKGKQRPPLSVVFVVDTSRSMEGENLERVKAALVQTLSRLRIDDEFGIIAFSTTPVWIAKLQEVGLKGINSAMAEIKGLQAHGYTCLTSAWTEACSQIMTSWNQIKRVVIISDGLVGAPKELERLEACRSGGPKGVVTSTISLNQIGDGLAELLEASVDVGTENLRAELELPDHVHAELLSSFPASRYPKNPTLVLGDPWAKEKIELLFRLDVPAMEIGQEVEIKVRVASSNSQTIAKLSLRAEDAEPEVTCMDTLAGALFLEALELREKAQWLETKKRYAQAQTILMDFVTRVAELPYDPRLMQIQILVEQDARYYGRPEDERFDPERTVVSILTGTRARLYSKTNS